MLSFDAQGKLCLKLQAQSPMIHFQAREPGATLRASEVKPKLDRYLLWRLQQETGQDAAALAKHPEYRDWFRPSTDEDTPPTALRYQMQIFCEEAPEIVVLNLDQSLINDYLNKYYSDAPKWERNKEKDRIAPYSIFYANNGKKTWEEQRLGIVSDPTVVIHCFCAPLKTWIADNLEDFFLVTNFGTMQNKGFGSFAPEEKHTLDRNEIRRIARLLKQERGVQHCLCMNIPRSKKEDFFPVLFRSIEHFYRLMKSGYNNNASEEYERSFLFCYMHDEFKIGNEKAWMKQEGVSPAIGRKFPLPSADHPPRYVRAFLGTAETMSYKKQLKGNDRIDISIKSSKNQSIPIQRAPSTIFFKIIGNTVLIVPCPVADDLYGKPFTFTPKEKDSKKHFVPSEYRSGSLNTPDKNQFPDGRFDTEAFLLQYGQHYNNLVALARQANAGRRSKVDTLYKYLNNAPEVTPI